MKKSNNNLSHKVNIRPLLVKGPVSKFLVSFYFLDNLIDNDNASTFKSDGIG
jgi:hypothetical protein